MVFIIESYIIDYAYICNFYAQYIRLSKWEYLLLIY